MYNQWALSIEDAKQIAAACRACAEQNGWNVVIAIVDDGAHTMYLERLDGTQKASSVVAVEKAKTALLFKRPTKAIEEVVKAGRNVMMMLPGATPMSIPPLRPTCAPCKTGHARPKPPNSTRSFSPTTWA